MIITNLKQGVKNPNRVNVFVDGKYSFSLDVMQVVDLGIKIGLEITDVQLAEYKTASEFGKLYQRALEWALMRPRSIRETREYLSRKLKTSSSGRSSEDVFEFSEEIIQRLISKGYLDDLRFAEYFVENRFVKKGVSKKRLRMELMRKGIAKEIIEEVLGGRDDEEEIRKIIARKRARYDDEKLMAYLVRQGFSYDQAHKAIEEYED